LGAHPAAWRSRDACPLCHSRPVAFFASAYNRRYFVCAECELVHLTEEQRPDLAAERAHYETHENDPADAGYRLFLQRLVDPLLRRLPGGAQGLDYGSGPGPTLSVMLRERGFPMEIHDPFFAPDATVLRRSYDFITCSETVEHFFCPADEFDRLDQLLRPGGILAIMTSPIEKERPFESWYYARDPTHVCFYARRTMRWIGERFGWAPEFPARDVVIFRKAASPSTTD